MENLKRISLVSAIAVVICQILIGIFAMDLYVFLAMPMFIVACMYFVISVKAKKFVNWITPVIWLANAIFTLITF